MNEISDDFVHQDDAGKFCLGVLYIDDADPDYQDHKAVKIDTQQFRPTDEDNARLLQKVLALQVDGRRFEKVGGHWHLLKGSPAAREGKQ